MRRISATKIIAMSNRLNLVLLLLFVCKYPDILVNSIRPPINFPYPTPSRPTETFNPARVVFEKSTAPPTDPQYTASELAEALISVGGYLSQYKFFGWDLRNTNLDKWSPKVILAYI